MIANARLRVAALEEAFRAGEDAGEALVAGNGEAESAGEGLEDGFDLVMRGAAIEGAEVDVGAGGLCEALEKIFRELNLKIANSFRGDFCVYHAMWAPTEIDSSGGESFIHGHEEVSSAEDAAFRAERFYNGFAESDADVFDGVVLIYVEVAFGGEVDIERAVACD
jgi:hypothetical protein